MDFFLQPITNTTTTKTATIKGTKEDDFIVLPIWETSKNLKITMNGGNGDDFLGISIRPNLKDFEITMNGGNGNDALGGLFLNSNATLNGGNGNDSLDAHLGDNRTVTMNGGKGNDSYSIGSIGKNAVLKIVDHFGTNTIRVADDAKNWKKTEKNGITTWTNDKTNSKIVLDANANTSVNFVGVGPIKG